MTDLSLDAVLRCFWHPVCTEAELRDSGGLLAVTLLGQRLAVALLASGPAALTDRCPHRSTALSIGSVDGDGVRCAYHGWCFDGSGRCTDVPAMPGAPVPPRATVDAFPARFEHGLVWVHLTPAVAGEVPVPGCRAVAAPRVLAGAPYTWATSAPRRVENFVDLAHFAFVHDGTLGRRDRPVPPLPEVSRVRGELRFTYEPPPFDPASSALFGPSDYRMPLPLTVDIEFRQADGATRWLWMTASPVTATTCRTFWYVARDDDLDGDDAAHMAFQQVVLDEDEPVVCAQDPAELPLDATAEVSVRTDRVSLAYRRWLRELAEAADDPTALVAVLDGRLSPPCTSARSGSGPG